MRLFGKNKKMRKYFKIKVLIALILALPLIIIAALTDIIFFVYIFILNKIFKQKEYYVSFTNLIIYWK